MHNIQPSGDFEYRVRGTKVAECELLRLTISYEHAIGYAQDLTEQQKQKLLADIRSLNTGMFDAAILLAVSDDHLKKAYELCATGGVQHIGELLELAIADNHSLYCTQSQSTSA
jgi:hypothetical protein